MIVPVSRRKWEWTELDGTAVSRRSVQRWASTEFFEYEYEYEYQPLEYEYQPLEYEYQSFEYEHK
jgi:hypothetical protein